MYFVKIRNYMSKSVRIDKKIWKWV